MSAKPRVLHVVVAGEIGGAERMLVELASRPSTSGAEHVIALMTPSEPLARMLRDAGLDVRDRGRVREDVAAFLWRQLGPADVAWLASTMKGARATITQLHTFASQVVGTRAAIRADARIVRTEHSTRVYVDPSCWPFSRWSLRRADCVVAISRHVHDVALEKAPWCASKLRIVMNGVDVARFAPRARVAAGDASPIRFVIVGRLEPRKGIDVALDALALVPGARLDVVGDGESRASLESHARARGVADRVRFLGYLADPRDVLAESDAAMCSSREEGLGIALLEAMAMGLPVVAVPVGGVPEIVRHRENGLLAETCDAPALAARMREAAGDRAATRALGASARELVVANASIDAMCAGWRDVYESLASR